jgi:hypothetical protein
MAATDSTVLFQDWDDSIRDLDYNQGVQGGMINILGGHSIGRSKQKSELYMYSIPNGFRDRVISLCRSLDLAPNIVLPSRLTEPLSEACESV